ncbi:MAG: ornithine cyclodeaminase family protein [Acidobacteria bacterium]|nr:ornithine cyclodeaminase family protein [Acidobacteriota bacterium]
MLYLTEADVEQLLTMPIALEAVETAFRHLGTGKAENIPRRRLHLPQGSLHLMAASLPELGYMGYKAYTVFRGRLQFYFWLYESGTGALVCMMEANLLGQVRTGAASGVATRWMARQDAQTAGILGAGWQARSQLEAVCRVRPVQRVLAFCRTADRLEHFCEAMQERLAVPCLPAKSAEAVVDESDILITITNSSHPVFDGGRIRPGTHINAAGGNSLARRELDEACLRRCGAIVVDSRDQARLECGEFLRPIERGLLHWEQVGELGEVVTGRRPPRSRPEEITLFKSLGLAIEDVAVAARVYRVALERNKGHAIPSIAGPPS